MRANVDRQFVHDLASELSRAFGVSTRIETDMRTWLGRNVIELRVFLLQVPSSTAAEQWVGLYRHRLEESLASAGLELAADEWFTPSQRFPSCGCWIERESVPQPGRREARSQKQNQAIKRH
jgi:hypothetical protein